MGIPKPAFERYTYADYLSWPEGERWELIEGFAWDMSLAPSRRHQEVVLNMASIIRKYLDGKPCSVFISPFDVRLPFVALSDDDIDTVVQPDISVFCDATKLDDRGAVGAPDMVVEVLSPSTAKKDLSIKLLLYQRVGVREYWIVDPDLSVINIFRPAQDGLYSEVAVVIPGQTMRVGIFPDLEIDIAEVFTTK